MACSVYGCNNNSVTATDPSIRFYYFPKQPDIAEQWIRACAWQENIIDLNTGVQNFSFKFKIIFLIFLARICSIHFANDCFTPSNCYSKILKYDAIPTLYLPLAILSSENAAVENFNDFKLQSFVKLQSPEEHLRLNTLKQENATLEKQIDELKSEIDRMRNSFNETKNKLRDTETECNSIRSKYNSLQVSAMSAQKQKSLLSKVFSESQIKILSGKKKIYWSNDDMAMGYTLRHLSNKRCYTYLTKHLNIPLPALSSIKRWATVKKNECNQNEEK